MIVRWKSGTRSQLQSFCADIAASINVLNDRVINEPPGQGKVSPALKPKPQ